MDATGAVRRVKTPRAIKTAKLFANKENAAVAMTKASTTNMNDGFPNFVPLTIAAIPPKWYDGQTKYLGKSEMVAEVALPKISCTKFIQLEPGKAAVHDCQNIVKLLRNASENTPKTEKIRIVTSQFESLGGVGEILILPFQFSLIPAPALSMRA